MISYTLPSYLYPASLANNSLQNKAAACWKDVYFYSVYKFYQRCFYFEIRQRMVCDFQLYSSKLQGPKSHANIHPRKQKILGPMSVAVGLCTPVCGSTAADVDLFTYWDVYSLFHANTWNISGNIGKKKSSHSFELTMLLWKAQHNFSTVSKAVIHFMSF